MTPVIEVKDLVKRYRAGERNAVDGISFDVEEGSFFALLGENGAGKTTTISILTTTLAPTSGSVRIAGYDVEKQAAQVRANVGIIFQQPSLDLNLTAEENIRFHAILYGLHAFAPTFKTMPRSYQAKVQELATILGIADTIHKPVKTFSGGMKRKLEILRSLMHEPRVLMLDEPTTGLDPASRRNLWDYLSTVRREQHTTLLLTTHYLEEAETADCICVLSRGKIVAYGTLEEIKAELVREYLLIDAAVQYRPALEEELRAKGVPFAINGGLRLDIKAAEMHQLLKQIETPLTVIRPHSPTLEEAYLALVQRESEAQPQ